MANRQWGTGSVLRDRRRQAGDVGAAPQQPPAQTRERATDHGPEGATDRTASADAAQQRAEGVVVGGVFDPVQHQGGGGARHACEKPDERTAQEYSRVRRATRSIYLEPMEIPRLLFVHAHPDDETISTGATIAHYAARGAQVNVVTCTLGEEGEVIGDRWAHLAVDAADQLGGYRILELSSALTRIGSRRTDLPRWCGPLARLGNDGHAAAGAPAVHRRRSARGHRRAGGDHPRPAPTRRRHL